jgi:hypothetical protein
VRLFAAILGLLILVATGCSDSGRTTTPQKGNGVQMRLDRNELPKPHDKKQP